jgi:pyruvate formate lyase activating enzyme
VVLTTYGRSSGFCVDPIEKKPLNHFLPGTAVLSFGTAGCNLACRFCQNWDISKSREIDTLSDAAAPEAIARAALDLGCRSVAFTYNDPVIFMEYAIDIARACREVGIKAVAVTAGYMCAEPRAEFYAHMDAANVDLKGFTDDFYHRVCAGHLEPVLETLEYLAHETSVWFEITNLLIPGANDSDREIGALSRWVVERLGPDVPLHFTAFHPDWKMTDRPPTPAATLTRARRIAIDNGLRYAYTGNVHDTRGGTTYCYGCAAPLVERDWFELQSWGLDGDGRCRRCGARCPGVFEETPGTWGARRLPVRLGQAAVGISPVPRSAEPERGTLSSMKCRGSTSS